MTCTLYTPPEPDQKPWQYFYQSMQKGFENGWINHDPANNINTASPFFNIVPKGQILMIVQGVNTLLGSMSDARHAHRKFLMIYENPAKNIKPTPVFANYDDERQIFTGNFVMTIHTERDKIRQAFSELVESFSQPSTYKLNKNFNIATPNIQLHSIDPNTEKREKLSSTEILKIHDIRDAISAPKNNFLFIAGVDRNDPALIETALSRGASIEFGGGIILCHSTPENRIFESNPPTSGCQSEWHHVTAPHSDGRTNWRHGCLFGLVS